MGYVDLLQLGEHEMNMDDEDRNKEDGEEREECEREGEDEREEAWEEYKESIRDLKDQYREILHDWEDRMRDWKNQIKERTANGSFSHFALPPSPPIPPIPPMHAHMISAGRANVVASRIGDEDLRLIDMLMEAGIFNTRSEAVAYLVSEGIKARRDTFKKVSESLEEIRVTRKAAETKTEELRQEIGIRKPMEKTKTDETHETDREENSCPRCHSRLSAKNARFCHSCGTKLNE